LKFLNFIQTFRGLFMKMISTSGGQSKHLMAGIQKLEEAARLVDDLSRKAQQQKGLLKQKQIEANQAMQMITKSLEEKAERK
jgi:dynein heavy chain 2